VSATRDELRALEEALSAARATQAAHGETVALVARCVRCRREGGGRGAAAAPASARSAPR
jgi:hypothetical protein